MSFMSDFYKRFVKEEYDDNGLVTKFDLDLIFKLCYNFRVNHNMPYQTYPIASQEATLKNSIPILQS